MMRKLLLAVPAAATLGLVSLAGAAPAFAYGPQGGNAIISTSVTTQPNGVIDITVSGGPFACNEIVNVDLSSPPGFLGSTPTVCSGGKGSIDATFQLQQGYPAGNHYVVATGSVSGDTGSASFSTSKSSNGTSPCTEAHVDQSHVVVLASFVRGTCLNSIPPAVSPPQGAVGAPVAAGSPAAVGAPAAVGGPKDGAVGNPSQSALPLTGADVVGISVGGAGTVLVGGLLVLASRRRRASRF